MRVKISVKALKRHIGFIILFLAYYPSFVARIIQIPFWGGVCKLLIISSCLYFSLILIRLKRINMLIILSIMFFGFLNSVTFFSGNENLWDSTIRMINCISFIITVEYLFLMYGVRSATNILMFFMEVINYANLLSMIIFPNGMYHTEWVNGMDVAVKSAPNYVRTTERVHWLMGHQSITIRFVLPAICIAILYTIVNNNKTNEMKTFFLNKRSLFLICACLAEIVIASSGGNFIFLLLFFILILIQKNRNIFKTWWVLVGVDIFYLSASMLAEMALFDWISVIVKRSVDLISRCKTWYAVVEAWKGSPIFGYGYINETSYVTRSLMNNYGNPHSDYLWVLFEGGIIGIILFIWLLLTVGKKAENRSGVVANVVFSAFICLLIMMLDDDHIFRSQYIFVLMSLCYHISDFDRVKMKNIICYKRDKVKGSL